jgi:hypothetical protein
MRCNSQFTALGHKCERVRGHDGNHATRDCISTSTSGWDNLTPALAAIIDWEPEGVASATPQPPPVRNGHPAVTDLVLADFQARDAFGTRKYGTRLQPHNGRDALVDMYQELLDACCYTRQLIFERDGK